MGKRHTSVNNQYNSDSITMIIITTINGDHVNVRIVPESDDEFYKQKAPNISNVIKKTLQAQKDKNSDANRREKLK